MLQNKKMLILPPQSAAFVITGVSPSCGIARSIFQCSAFYSTQFFFRQDLIDKTGNIGNIRINVDVQEHKEYGGDWEQIKNVDSGQKRYYPGRRRRASV